MDDSRTILITPDHKSRRLDRFLADFDASLSRSAWQKRIKAGQVLVNGITAKTDYALKEGDELEILPELAKSERTLEIPDIGILYEDDDVIVIDKPIGIVAQRTVSSSAPTVTDFLEEYFPAIARVGEEEQRSGIVHRLDKDTSGIMIAAKTQEAFTFLKDKFQNRTAEKIYTALVYGQVDPAAGEINLPIGRNPRYPCRQTIVRNPEKAGFKSRPARTLYRTLKSSQRFTLLDVELKTGRMHQIRVHMKAIGHPIVGDQKYSPSSLLLTTPSLKRQFLHASELKIELPDGKIQVFHSSLPHDLKTFLDCQVGLD